MFNHENRYYVDVIIGGHGGRLGVDKVADMKVELVAGKVDDRVANMVANVEVNKVADMVNDMDFSSSCCCIFSFYRLFALQYVGPALCICRSDGGSSWQAVVS